MAANFFSWLHLTDLHYGLNGQGCLWPTLREPLLKSLDKLHEKSGPWDAVLFTGDLVQSGEAGQFGAMQADVLEPLWEKLRELGSGEAVLLAVPGNHDLQRPTPGSGAVDMLLLPTGFSHIAETFWTVSESDYRAVIDEAFAAYTTWWADAPHRPDGLREGMLAGDFAVTLERGYRRIGIVGLNTTFLQLAEGDYKKRLVWHPQQLAALFDDGVDRWVNDHDACLLLTHQGPDWLTDEARERGSTEITPSNRFAVHLFGHQHETEAKYVRYPGDTGAVWQCQGCSVFGMEKSGEPPTVARTHGYATGRIAFRNDAATLRLWPLTATGKPNGWRFKPDHDNLELQEDGGTSPEPVAARPRALPPEAAKTEAPEPNEPPIEPRPPSDNPLPADAVRLYGRDELLDETEALLERVSFLILYGLRGNGKSEIIRELARRAGRTPLHFFADEDTTRETLYRHIAHNLGDLSENKHPPAGSPDEIAAEIAQRFPNPEPAWVWIDSGHKLLGTDGFRDPEVRALLLGLQQALGDRWTWIFELRERPPERLLVGQSEEREVPGLDSASLFECLADAAPPGQAEAWQYTKTDRRAIYQWLGGGQGDQAHPHATQLLIEVARGRNESPLQVLQRHRHQLEERMEGLLLNDLYDNVLKAPARHMLDALALYRKGIPHDHIDTLERHLGVQGWEGLDRRCLLALSADHQRYFLHGFVAAWVRSRKHGYADDGEQDALAFREDAAGETKRRARNMHGAIASCFLKQLGQKPRTTSLNIDRALEAFHHLVAAGDAHRVKGIAVSLLGANLEWARKRMEAFYKQLFESRAPIHEQAAALEYRALLEPESHMVQRFLGEAYRKLEGDKSDKALACFEKACDMRRDFPPYWANLGNALLALGHEGARAFLERLEAVEKGQPEAVDAHVRAIQARSLELVGRGAEASALRMAEIERGSRDPALYSDEAKALLDAGDAEGALGVLDLAEANGATNSYTTAIRASVLAALG
ncbi:MAG: metallophosphoesterase, partial [Bacteroidota bacterium]